jgi:LAO/AO transport system kinase
MVEKIIKDVLKGDPKATARLISLVENEEEKIFEIMKKIYPYTGKAYYIGITGPPGAGKSSISNKIIEFIRKDKKTVGVLAVDPTSPFSGGAILGDRIRMQEHFLDSGVFIRSMATRGSLGGIAKRTIESAKILDAKGCDFIILETVGIGQIEIDIMECADTIVVVLSPDFGDSIQTMKAGILEIADILVVNKKDKEGARELYYELKNSLDSKPKEDGFIPPLVLTSTIKNEGIEEMWREILNHKNFQEENNLLEKRRQKQIISQLNLLIEEKIREKIYRKLGERQLEKFAKEIFSKKIDPYSVVEKILRKIEGKNDS